MISLKKLEMPETKKKRHLFLRILAVFGLFLLLGILYILIVSRISPPKIADQTALNWQRAEPSPGFYTIKNNWLRKSKSGLYELYVEGQPFERGVVNGRLSKELIQLQEDYFSDQINKRVPAKWDRHFLKY